MSDPFIPLLLKKKKYLYILVKVKFVFSNPRKNVNERKLRSLQWKLTRV